ncbi:ATP-binding protein [Sphingorhabdus sp.]|uniref:ATP-binding protein n=1 Tax=Sphingorhabdus sp. TaxID=1902408 RepID=UPI00359492E1
MRIIDISAEDASKILLLEESHFSDLKSKRIAPSKLTRTISAMANADGGEIFIGIEDDPRAWDGFSTIEDFNAHIQTFERVYPLNDGSNCSFLKVEGHPGYVLKMEILKSQAVVFASDKIAYLRRSAQNLPQDDSSSLERLRRNKGIVSFEAELVNVERDLVEDSDAIKSFTEQVVPNVDPAVWLKKQQLIKDSKPTVAGVMLFADEPQALLPKRSGIKIYRYQTREDGERATLAFDPVTMEGNAYNLIYGAVKKTVEIIENIKIMTSDGLSKVRYPKEALHEIVTNAVLHRDYSVPDDIHIRIFENRIEVQSPGLLPAHITPDNILQERFSRNGVIVRLINKFPDPPNKDVGEGLNTAFEAMKTMKLVAPVIIQAGMNVIVTLKHESLGSPEMLIMEYLEKNDFIMNKQAREIANVQSENAMKHILRRLVEAGMLEVVKGKTVFDTKYIKKTAEGAVKLFPD